MTARATVTGLDAERARATLETLCLVDGKTVLDGEAVVMVSLADWTAMEETLHLLSSPANAGRLVEAIRQLDAGGGKERELIEP